MRRVFRGLELQVSDLSHVLGLLGGKYGYREPGQPENQQNDPNDHQETTHENLPFAQTGAGPMTLNMVILQPLVALIAGLLILVIPTAVESNRRDLSDCCRHRWTDAVLPAR